jgi:hypothetical protein
MCGILGLGLEVGNLQSDLGNIWDFFGGGFWWEEAEIEREL